MLGNTVRDGSGGDGAFFQASQNENNNKKIEFFKKMIRIKGN